MLTQMNTQLANVLTDISGRVSGDKIIGKGRRPTNNRITVALKMAATSLKASNTYPRAQFR